MMWKNFLKTSVSVFVLLGAISTLSPSQAMEEDKPNSSTRKSWQNPEGLDGNFSDFPEELTQTILLQVEPQALPSVAIACQKWLRLSLDDQNFLKAFYKKAKQNPELLKQLISCSPRRIIPLVNSHFDEAALLYPSTLVNLENKETDFEHDVPESIQDFAIAIEDSSICHSFITKKIMGLDPLDSYKVALASYIVRYSPQIKEKIKEFTDNSTIDINDFPELIKNSNNHPSLQQYLMALKLLTLGKDTEVPPQMDTFRSKITTLLSSNILDEEEVVLEEYAHFVNQPFWSAYTDSIHTHVNQIYNARLLTRSSHTASLDPEKFHKFSDYVFTVFPSFLSTGSVANLYLSIYEIYEAQGKHAEQLVSLDKFYRVIDKNNLGNFLMVSELYSDLDEYKEALDILDKASAQVGEQPIYFIFQKAKAECILNLNLNNRFSESRAYLDSFLKQFPENETKLSHSYTFFDKEGVERGKVTYKTKIKEIYALKGALHIFESQFEEAYQCLLQGPKSIDDLLFKALNTQLHNPDLQSQAKLIQLLSEKLEKKVLPDLLKTIKEFSSKDRSERLQFIKEHADVYNFLLQDKPEARQTFEEVLTLLES